MSKTLRWGLFLLSFAIPAIAQDFCQWEDTPLFFSKEKVRLNLIQDVTLEGKWIGIDAQMAKFVVSKSSNRKLYSRGLVSIHRDRIRAAAYRGHGSFGKVLGLLAGLSLAGPAVVASPRALVLPAFFGLVAGGIYAGNAADRRWHEVTILP